MKRLKRYSTCMLGLLLTSVMVFHVGTMTSMAASRKKITSVNVEVTADIQPEMRYGDEDIEVEVRSNSKYYYDYYEIENDGFEWLEDDVPQITIYLGANDGYYFSLSKASAVKLTGATYVKASKQDSSRTLKLTVKLPSLKESVAEQTEVFLTEGGYAYWDAVRGAGSYEVRLYRNGDGQGASILTTTDTHYDFTSMMGRQGTYYVKVRPVNKINTDNKREWRESDGVTLNTEMANAIRNGTAPKLPELSERGVWHRLEDGRWWYEHSDGTYTKSNWEEIKGEWYFFDEEGYMKTGWIDWNGVDYYCGESGAMLKDTTTPDGYILDSNGRLKNDRH